MAILNCSKADMIYLLNFFHKHPRKILYDDFSKGNMMEEQQRQMDNSKLSSFGCSISKDNLIEENVRMDKKTGGTIDK